MTNGEPSLHFDRLLLPDGWAGSVRLTVRDGLITAIEPNVEAGPGDEAHGIGLPGMPNLHSHAFQRGMAGLAEVRGSSGDSFWTWREVMYRFVDRLDPSHLTAIAALAYVEMLESGFTRVGEFHYLHHDRDGRHFADPAEMTAAIAAAAEETGIALTHLPVFYAHGGFGGQPTGKGQRRFLHDIDGFARLLEAARPSIAALPDGRLGVAPHSLRAVALEELVALIALADEAPIHIHVAEQQREVDDCLAWSGARPVAWLFDHVPVDARWCLIHATHINVPECDSIGASGAVVGLCPITEANLGDGIFPAEAARSAGVCYGIGSDSNVRIDMTEELRLLEYGQRLARQERNLMAFAPGQSSGGALYRAALTGGARALGTAAGILIGASADLVSLNSGDPALAGRSGDMLLDGLIFASGERAIDCVWRRGVKRVVSGRHRARERIAARYIDVVTRLIE